jgi:hypothetical protein
MKLIWHIIRKDIVRDRWALLLWAALFVAQVFIGAVLLHDKGADRDWIMQLQVVNGGLVALQFVAGYVLVARLVHADLLLGTDMFWATRPISRRRLFAAKIGAAVLIFGLLPVALLAPWWLWCGFTLRDAFWTGVDTFGWQLLMIAPAFLIASLTNDLGRVLLWTVLLFVAGMLWAGLLASIFQVVRSTDETRMTYLGAVYTRTWLAGLLFVLFAVAIAAHHYLTNRLVRSGVLAAAGAGMVVAVGLFLPWDWSAALTDLTMPASSQDATVALAGVKAEVGYGLPDTRMKLRGEQERTLITEVYLQGLPEDLVINSGMSQQSWHWEDGVRIKRWNFAGTGWMDVAPLLRRTYSLPKSQQDPETQAWQKAKMEEMRARRAASASSLPVSLTPLPPSRHGRRQFIYATVPEGLIKRAQMEPPAYEADLKCVVTQPVIVADLPLQAGVQGGANSVQVRVKWLGDPVYDKSDAGLPASILVTTPMLRSNGLWLAGAMRAQRTFLRDEIWAINRRTGGFAARSIISRQSTRTASIAGVLLSWNTPTINAERVIRNGEWVLRDPRWVEHTTLVVVSETMAGRLNLALKSDQVVLRRSRYLEDGESPR